MLAAVAEDADVGLDESTGHGTGEPDERDQVGREAE